MKDFTELIGRVMICRTENTERLYQLEEEAYDSVKRAAQEHQRLLSNGFSEEEAASFSTADELFSILDYFRPESLQAARGLLGRHGYEVTKKPELENEKAPRDPRGETAPVEETRKSGEATKALAFVGFLALFMLAIVLAFEGGKAGFVFGGMLAFGLVLLLKKGIW
jgi:hypothetical protein